MISARTSRHLPKVLMVFSVILAAQASGVQLGSLFDGDGAKNALQIFAAFGDPDLSSDFLARIAKLSFESVLIGVLATVIAVLIGFVGAILSLRLPDEPETPGRAPFLKAAGAGGRWLVRLVLTVFRSIPDIIWAYLFVRVIGLGPGPAVFAIAISTAGIVGKLFGELAEAVDPETIHALRRAGVGRLGIICYGVLPQVWKQWVAYTFFRLECSVRSAAIVGVVGAGGLGSEISLSARYFQYDRLATALLAVLAFVIVTELLSAYLRRKPFKWAVWFAVIGSAAALYWLKIPWSEITPSKFIPEWLLKQGSQDQAAFLRHAIGLALETTLMAWCATWVAALFAFVLAALSARHLTIGNYRQDSPRGRGVRKALGWLCFLVARLVLQVTRAAPELTLALVFVLWVGPGPFAGVLAIAVHTVGVLGRLYSDVLEEVNPRPVAALEAAGAGRLGVGLYGVAPQVSARVLAFTLYRFEVNVRATAMVGFVGAGGLGDAIHTAISLFHGRDLLLLIGVLIGVVIVLDLAGARARRYLLTRRFRAGGAGAAVAIPARAPAHPFARAAGVRLYLQGVAAARAGKVRSSSDAGMFIETPEAFDRGDVVEIVPAAADGDRSAATVLGRVAYARAGEVPGIGVVLIG